MQPTISIITVNYNALEVTCELLESIRRVGAPNVEVIVVDNGSIENPERFLKHHYPEIKFVRSEQNLGFAGGNNLGIRVSHGDFLFFLNNDAELTAGAIETLVALFESNPRVGIASPKICFHNVMPGKEPDIIQYVGSRKVHSLTARNKTFGEREIDKGQYQHASATAYAHGAAMMVPRKVIEKVGLMPEEFFLYYEELDWCEQIHGQGFEVYVEPNAKIYHKESYSVNQISALKTYYLTRNRILFMRRNRAEWQLALFYLFLLFFTLPKNTFGYLIKGDWEQLKAFYNGMMWNFTPKKRNKPVSTPLTFSSTAA